MLHTTTVSIFKPDSLLRLERFTKHPVRKNAVSHGREENLFWQLQEIVLREALAGHDGSSKALTTPLKFAPVSFLLVVIDSLTFTGVFAYLADQGHIVDHHQVQK